MNDAAVAAAQIGRPLRSPVDVAVRCHLDLPIVIRVPPILDEGTPFPTTFWLSCPLAVRRIGRLESAGGVRAMDRRSLADSEFGAALDAAHERYRSDRDALLAPGVKPAPSGGVAGAGAGVKCLHAHYADHAAGNENPVGAVTAPWVEPLDCATGCVVEGESGLESNTRWVEPR